MIDAGSEAMHGFSQIPGPTAPTHTGPNITTFWQKRLAAGAVSPANGYHQVRLTISKAGTPTKAKPTSGTIFDTLKAG